MKKLALYSDQVPGKSDEIDKKLMELIDKENPRIAYIPSRADTTRKYYKQKVEYYRRLGISDLMYFDIDMEYQSELLDKLLACDAIHLSGGDTFYFLSSIKRHRFIDVLKKYVLGGGVLIGVSAGSILMSQCIDVAGLLDEHGDESCGTEALDLVDFEFVPHWEKNNFYLDRLLQYSREKDIKIYCCSDSDGIIVNGDEVSFIGEVIELKNGSVYTLQNFMCGKTSE